VAPTDRTNTSTSPSSSSTRSSSSMCRPCSFPRTTTPRSMLPSVAHAPAKPLATLT